MSLVTQCEDVCGQLYPHWYQYHLFVGCISGCHGNAEVVQAWSCYSSCMVDIHACPVCLIGGQLQARFRLLGPTSEFQNRPTCVGREPVQSLR